MPAALTQTSSRPCSVCVARDSAATDAPSRTSTCAAGGRTPEIRGRLAGCGVVEIGDDDGRSGLGEAGAARLSDAARAARDDSDPTREIQQLGEPDVGKIADPSHRMTRLIAYRPCGANLKSLHICA